MLLQERPPAPRSRTTRKTSRRTRRDADDRVDGPTRIVPRGPASSSARRASSLLPLRRLADAERQLCRRLRLIARARVTPAAGAGVTPPVGHGSCVALGAGLLTGLCFPPVDLGPVVLVALVPLLWTWRGARPSHAALYGFAFGVRVLRGGDPVDPLLRVRGVVPLVVVMAARDRGVGALVAACARRGDRVTVPHRRGLGGPGGPPGPLAASAGSRGPTSASRCTTSRAARALAGVGGTLLVSFVVVAVNGLRARPRVRARVPARRGRAVRRRRRPRRGRARDRGRRRHPLRAARPPAGCASRCSRATTRSCRSRSRPTSCSPRSTSRWPTGCTATTTSSCSPSRRSTPTPTSTRRCVPRIAELAAEHDAACW